MAYLKGIQCRVSRPERDYCSFPASNKAPDARKRCWIDASVDTAMAMDNDSQGQRAIANAFRDGDYADVP
jgi:hypothetical protein